jgi:hypothetical protein
LILDLLRTAASVAVPAVLVWATYYLQRRQKFFEATMNERVKHYSSLSPLLNAIYAYRMRLGDYSDKTPESVLDAKRKADQEFWTFEYLWSDQFRLAYHRFMQDSFRVFGAEGSKALIRVDGGVHPIKPSIPGWAGFSMETVNRQSLNQLYAELKKAIAKDLGFLDYSSVGPRPPELPPSVE